MGLEGADLVDYGDAAGGGKAASSVPCSICLEDVTDYGDRAWAKLHCGHLFHLDCIGSAFNAKGMMQCPNCRKTEKGQWLYADGGRLDDLVNDDDVYDLPYSEPSMWCPYGTFAQLTAAAAFDEMEFPTTAYDDIVGARQGQHGGVREHANATNASSATTHICPYIAYLQPLSTTNVAERPRYNNSNNQWNSQSASTNSYYNNLFPTTHHPSIPPRTNARSGPYANPLFATQSSGSRPPSSSMTHPYPGSGARAGAVDPYFQQPIQPPVIGPGPQRSNGQVQVAVGAPSDQARYYVSGRSFQDSESSMLNLVHNIWERDPPPHQHPVERAPPFQPAFRQRHGMPSQTQYWL